MRFIAIVLLVGCVWAAIAVALLLAMRVGDVPAPSEAPLVLAVVLVALYLPSLVGLGLETLLGRSAIGLLEVIAASLLSGVMLITILAAVLRATVARSRSALS